MTGIGGILEELVRKWDREEPDATAPTESTEPTDGDITPEDGSGCDHAPKES